MNLDLDLEQEPIYISKVCAERGCACHYSIAVDGDPVAVYPEPIKFGYTLHTSDKPLHHFALVLRDLDKTIDGWCEEPEFYFDGNRIHPEREWVDLTDDDIAKVKGLYGQASFETIARAIIAAFKEKNK